jgi:hypothetical protein
MSHGLFSISICMITDPSQYLSLPTKSLCCELLCLCWATKSFMPTNESTKLAVHYPCSGFLKKKNSRFFFPLAFSKILNAVEVATT